MSILKKNLMYFLVKLGIFAILHFSPFYYKGAECELVVKPQNVAILSGEDATLNCASNVSSDNIAWSSPTSSNYIYLGRVLASGISVSDKDDGNCTLQVNTSIMSMAKRYVCVERTTAHEASAELIILKSQVGCNSLVINGYVNVNCSVLFSGNWVPALECEQYNEGKGVIVLEGSRNTTLDNSLTVSTWTYTNYNTSYNISCLIKFEESGKPSGTSATNIPEYKATIIAYNGTEKTQPSPNTSGNDICYIITITASVFVIVVLVIVVIILIIQRKKTYNGMEKTQPSPNTSGNDICYIITITASICVIVALVIVVIILIIQRKKN